MILLEPIEIRLLLLSIPALIAIYLFFIKKKDKISILLLLLSAFMLRMYMITLDPFLQDWDERFHALVAKNMISNPFKPMLRVFPVMDYDPSAWCCNHIWVHKQPLFLWQMALSMKLFGVNEIAIRIPSVIMGTISVWFIYEIALFWTKEKNIAFISSVLMAFSFYQLELTTGRFSLDQNDVAFVFYVTASIWAFVKYLETKSYLKWAVIIGIFVGAAILNKWLPGLLVYGAWALVVLLEKEKRNSKKQYLFFLLSVLVSVIVFLPWQLYIHKRFPIESAFANQSNWKHIFESLSHEGSVWFHIDFIQTSYGYYFIPFLIIGILLIFFDKKIDKILSVSFIALIIIIYFFFSVIVKTKMPAFTYPVSSLMIILISYGVYNVFINIFRYLKIIKKEYLMTILISFIAIYSLKPWNISENRSVSNKLREAKINNTNIYKNLPDSITSKYVILNCKSFEDVELMFYKNTNAYHWWPEKRIIDSLKNAGYRLAAFKNHNNQNLPAYILQDKDILIIDKQLK